MCRLAQRNWRGDTVWPESPLERAVPRATAENSTISPGGDLRIPISAPLLCRVVPAQSVASYSGDFPLWVGCCWFRRKEAALPLVAGVVQRQFKRNGTESAGREALLWSLPCCNQQGILPNVASPFARKVGRNRHGNKGKTARHVAAVMPKRYNHILYFYPNHWFPQKSGAAFVGAFAGLPTIPCHLCGNGLLYQKVCSPNLERGFGIWSQLW